MERKLTAILAADVVGYSRLVSSDEAGTITRLKALRVTILGPCVARHNGRIVNTSGDGTLAEFASVVDAVLAGAEIIESAKKLAGSIEPGERLELRVGINIGDVLIDGDDILGDGVNVASRLEGLASPGEIWVSSEVYRQVDGKLKLSFEDLGEKKLKNIEKPVHVYRVSGRSLPGLEQKPKPLATHRGRNIRAFAAGVLALSTLAAFAFLGQPWLSITEPAKTERLAFPLPDKPSVAVLPFTNMSGDRSQEYFADGITEDLITDLSKLSALFVISRNSTFTYKGKSVKIRTVAEELGVRYVLEGSVRRAGDKVRINAQLIDTTTGGHVWADRYDGSLADVFSLQDRITRSIVTALSLRLTPGENNRLAKKGTESTAAYDAFLRGWSHYNQRTPKGFGEAIPHFKIAIDLDPAYGRAHAALASIYFEGALQRLWYVKLNIFWGEARRLGNEHLKKALEHPTPLAHRVASLTYLAQGDVGQVIPKQGVFRQDFERAMSEAQTAIELDPNDPNGHIAMAHVLTMSGRPREALDFVDKAMRLDPKVPSDYLFEKAFARFGLEQHAKADNLLGRAIAKNPENLFAAYLRIPNYALLGKKKQMMSSKEYFKRISPVDIAQIHYPRFWGLFKKKEDNWRMIEGLRAAGMANPY